MKPLPGMKSNSHRILSDDGSHTVIHPTFDVPYHSRRGALEESRVVFIENCLVHLATYLPDHIRIFEMGFGTGLNAFLTCIWAIQNKIKVHYEGVDISPLPDELTSSLNYADLLGFKEEWINIHATPWNTTSQCNPYFSCTKWNCPIEEYRVSHPFDGLFYDAFAPASQPELWDEQAAERLFQLLKPGGVMTTYCAQGQFRRNLIKAGFIAERLPGPPGKREMLRATRPLSV